MSAQNDFESMSRQAWEAWNRQWQPLFGAAAPAPAPAPGLDQGLQSLKAYLDWMQRAATGTMATPSVPHPFGATSPWMQPGLAAAFTHAPATPWGAAPMPGGLEDLRKWLQVPAVGYTREQQARQQALLLAMLDYQQAQARYNELLGRAQADGARGLQEKLAGAQGQVETLKALYGFWVDAFEEAYQAVALSEEFREVYGTLVNAQMRLRQLQQQEIEQWCREMGLPTRSEVETLGKRLQELRRELRARQDGAEVAAEPSRREPGQPAAKAPAAKTARKAAVRKAAPSAAAPTARKNSTRTTKRR